MSNLSPNEIKEISTRYVHFQSEPRPCCTATVTGVPYIVFSPAWKYLLSPPSGNIRLARRVPRPVRGAQIKTCNQPKGICPGKNGAGPSIRIHYHHSARMRERKREIEREEKERKMKREQEREDNISIVPRGERRERKFIPTPGFSKLVRRRGDRSISRKLAPLFSCLSSLSLSFSLVSRSPIPTREESKPDRFASTYSTMACLHGEH